MRGGNAHSTSAHSSFYRPVTPLREWFDAIHLNRVAVHVQFPAHFHAFANVLLGLRLVVELVTDLGHGVLKNEFAILLCDLAAESRRLVRHGIAGGRRLSVILLLLGSGCLRPRRGSRILIRLLCVRRSSN